MILLSDKKAENHRYSWVQGNIHNLQTTCVCSTTSHTIGLGSSAGDTKKYGIKNVLIYSSTCKTKTKKKEVTVITRHGTLKSTQNILPTTLVAGYYQRQLSLTETYLLYEQSVLGHWAMVKEQKPNSCKCKTPSP